MSLFRRPLTETASAPKTTFRERAAAWGKRGLKGFFFIAVRPGYRPIGKSQLS